MSSAAVEEALIAYLLAATAVSTLVGTRVVPYSLLQGSSLPAVTVQRISGAPLYADDGETGLENPRFQIDAWALTYSQAKTLARAVKDTLSAFAGTTGGVLFQYIMLENEQDLREGGANAAEYRYRTSLDFIVWNSN